MISRSLASFGLFIASDFNRLCYNQISQQSRRAQVSRSSSATASYTWGKALTDSPDHLFMANSCLRRHSVNVPFSSCVLVHNDPIRLQRDRFTSKQVEAPQALLHMTYERQPGGTAAHRRVAMYGGNPPNHILINDVPQAKLICSAICGHPLSGCAVSYRRWRGPNPQSVPSAPASFTASVKTATCGWRIPQAP
jgi:hypothetical protein